MGVTEDADSGAWVLDLDSGLMLYLTVCLINLRITDFGKSWSHSLRKNSLAGAWLPN